MRKNFPMIPALITLFMTACDISAADDRSSSTLPIYESKTTINESTAELPTEQYPAAASADNSDEISELPNISNSDAESSQEAETPTNKEENALKIEITIGEKTFPAALYDNETARAFKDLLPLTLDMSELNGNEKYYYLPDSLPTNSSCPSKIRAGDIMLYGNDCLVLFYEDFSTSYSYTPIGRIDDPNGLAAALGSGDVQVTFN